MNGGMIRMVLVAWALALVALFAGCAKDGGGGGSSGVSSVGPEVTTLSGTISAMAGATVDGDTNDPFSRWIPNDSSDIAQPIPSPVTVTGFVCASPTGVSGNRFETVADTRDVYRVSLVSGQIVSLQISDHPGFGGFPDLDLILYPAGDSTEFDAARSTGASEELTVATSGDYDLVVEARSGSSNYLLQVGVIGGGTAYQPDFVPGEVLVRFADVAPGGSMEEARAHRAAQTGLRVLGGGPGRTMRLALPQKRAARMAALKQLGVEELQLSAAAAGDLAELRRETRLALQALQSRPDVLAASLNYIRRAAAVPNDPRYVDQWHYDLINLPQAWDVETGDSNEVVVAVVDSGILPDHPDLAGKVVPGYDFVGDDEDPTDPVQASHGTHVAGTVAAGTDNGIGVAGVSWGAKIMPVRVLGASGTGTVDDIIRGIRWAAGLPYDYDAGILPQRPADIINLSLGGIGYSAVEELELAEVRASGVVIVAAAGNDRSRAPHYPAAYNGVFAVSAVDAAKQRAPYSNFGQWVDIAAPGGDLGQDSDGDGNDDGVLSTLGGYGAGTPGAGYEFWEGTSMAAPHVTGVVALMKASNPDFVNPDSVDALLVAGFLTEDVAGNGAALRDDVYGYGLIDAAKAVQAAYDMPKTVIAEPSRIILGPGESGGTFSLRESSGQGTLALESVMSSATWLQVSGSGLGDYTISVDRSGLADGLYGAVVTVSYVLDLGNTVTATDVRVSVVAQVGVPAVEDADVGRAWIVLVDPTNDQPAFVVTAPNVGGTYGYEFDGIPPGAYYVVTGSDFDDDGVICDPGEACGGYPMLDQLQVVEVLEGESLTLLDFGSAFSGDRDSRVPAGGYLLPSMPGDLWPRAGRVEPAAE